MSAVIRPAQKRDIPSMVALRAQLFADLAAQGSASRPDQAHDGDWHDTCAGVIATQLTHPDHRYSVAVTTRDRVLGWGHAMVIHQLPGPGFPTGLMGQISSVVTDGATRGQGLGSAVSADLLNWLREAGAEVVDLLASHGSAGIYRRLGFTEPRSTALRFIPS